MTVVARDTFTPDTGLQSSGAAPFSTVDGATMWKAVVCAANPPVAGDTFDYVIHFPTGNITLRLICTTVGGGNPNGAYEFRRISTITGNVFNVKIADIVSSVTLPQPNVGIFLGLTITRGAANNQTNYTARCSTGTRTSSPVTQFSGTFTTTGEQTPTGADFAIVGTHAFVEYQDLADHAIDGGGSGPLAIGTWVRCFTATVFRGSFGNIPADCEHVILSSGKALAQAAAAFDSGSMLLGGPLYALTGHGLTDADYAVAVTMNVTGATNGYAFLGGRVDAATGDGYWFVLSFFPSSYRVTLYKKSGTTFTQLDTLLVGSRLSTGAHVLRLELSGTTLTGLIDGATVVTTVDATYAATGNPGFGTTNDATAGTPSPPLFSTWELDDAPSGVTVPDPCIVEAARDDFTHPMDDIHFWLLDRGRWNRHAASAVAIAVDASGAHVATGSGRGFYRAELIPGLGDDYCVEATTRISSTGGSCLDSVPWWDPGWTYEASGVTLGPAPGHGFGFDVSGNVADLLGHDNFFGHGNAFKVWDLTLAANGQPIAFKCQVVNPANEPVDGSWLCTIRFLTNIHALAPGTHTFAFDATSLSGAPGAAQEMRLDIASGEAQAPWSGSSTVHLSKVGGGTFVSFSSADHQQGALSTPGSLLDHVISPILIDGDEFTDAPAGDPLACPHGVTTVGVRYDAVADTGYLWEIEFLQNSVQLVRLCWLWVVTAGTRHRLFSVGAVPASYDTDYTLRLRVADHFLVASLNGVSQHTFNLDTEAAGDGSGLAPIYETGDPVFGLQEYDGPATWLHATPFVVYAPTNTDPCEGTIDNPYPHQPPPYPPVPLGGIDVMLNGVWEPVPIERVREYLGGSARSTLLAKVEYRGAWSALAGGLGEVPPPENTPLPPFYDPCEILPPIDPGTVTPVPPTGGRFFGMYGMPPTVFGAVFDSAMRAVGRATLVDLPQAVARGGRIGCGIGPYDQFTFTGAFDMGRMFAWIERIASEVGAFLKAQQDLGNFLGQLIADDFRSPRLWPPSGLSDAQLTTIAAKWNLEIPGLRLGLRDFPTNFPHGPIPGVTFYTAGPIIRPPTVNPIPALRAIRDRELGRMRAWAGGQILMLIPNWLHGGNGSSGIQWPDGWPGFVDSPGEIVSIADAWFGDGGGGYADLIWGANGFKYYPDLITIPGMLDALTYYRNLMYALPPFA